MSEAADDCFDAEMRQHREEDAMRAAGCRRCHHQRNSNGESECPVCHDLGWLNANGEPCEP